MHVLQPGDKWYNSLQSVLLYRTDDLGWRTSTPHRSLIPYNITPQCPLSLTWTLHCFCWLNIFYFTADVFLQKVSHVRQWDKHNYFNSIFYFSHFSLKLMLPFLICLYQVVWTRGVYLVDLKVTLLASIYFLAFLLCDRVRSLWLSQWDRKGQSRRTRGATTYVTSVERSSLETWSGAVGWSDKYTLSHEYYYLKQSKIDGCI